MPVARGPQFNARNAVLVGATAVVIAAVMVIGVLWLAGSSGDVEVRLGDADFNAGRADRIAGAIVDDGPILFSDVASGTRDIILQHIGDDPTTGWSAFDARRPDTARDCFFEWQPVSQDFANRCDPGDVIDERGTGLVSYPVTVDDDGDVRVDITNPQEPR